MWDRQKALRGVELLGEALALLDAIGEPEAAAYTSMAIETVGVRLRDDDGDGDDAIEIIPALA